MAAGGSCAALAAGSAQASLAIGGGGAHVRSQLTRSLDRIFEEASASGELRLSGRKLKDFPNTGKYQLADTVLADLSKNRFGEVPDEVTAFYFLEKLLLYHNAIRNVPDTIGMLQSLSYLDLSRNQLTAVPRELCQLPLQVLLLSNNRLTSLPKEIGKMSILAELDASNNLITQLPMNIGDLQNLRALNLRNNQLGLLPLQITYLQLEILDISCNSISSLPLELRLMTSLVTLNLEHNPLVSPPATVCVRGRIHIFKYLDNQANKDNIQKRGDDTRRSTKQNNYTHLPYTNHTQAPGSFAVDGLRHKVRYNVDSGYSTSDGGEKRWSSDGIGNEENLNIMPVIMSSQNSGRSTPSTPSTISPGPAHLSRTQSLSTETPPTTPTLGSRISPDGNNVINGDDKTKSLSQQTYRQYKEALRQQRQQDVYRPRGEQISPSSTTPTATNHSYSTPHSPVANGYHNRNIVSSNPSLASQSSPTNTMSSNHSTPKKYLPPTNTLYQTSSTFNSTDITNSFKNDELAPGRKPVQKVVPSRNTNKNYSPTNIPVSNSNSSLSPILSNGNSDISTNRLTENRNCNTSATDGSYIKPISPIKGSSSFMSHNNVPTNKSNSLGRNYKTSPTENNGSDHIPTNGTPKLFTTSVSYVNNTTPATGNNTSRINWSKDLPPDKLSFTMKREFDRAKEESELIQQLRSIIENRLKMTLPRELAPVLADGVVLCHLANHVCPRSVASVHVPSAAQPKLTMARCRRNVDNFLEACRKIGVEEDAVCQPHDILSLDADSQDDSFARLAAIFKTINELLKHRPTPAHATENYENHFAQQFDNSSELGENNENHSHTLLSDVGDTDKNDNNYFDCNTQNHLLYHNSKNNFNSNHMKSVHRSRYAEDRCISNFNMFSNNFSENIVCDNAEIESKDVYMQNNNEKQSFTNSLDFQQVNGFADKNQNNESNYSQSGYSYSKIENKINYVVPRLNEKLIVKDDNICDSISSQTMTKLMCCAADVLEGKGVVQVAITVSELHRKQVVSGSKTGNGIERRTVLPPPI